MTTTTEFVNEIFANLDPSLHLESYTETHYGEACYIACNIQPETRLPMQRRGNESLLSKDCIPLVSLNVKMDTAHDGMVYAIYVWADGTAGGYRGHLMKGSSLQYSDTLVFKPVEFYSASTRSGVLEPILDDIGLY